MIDVAADVYDRCARAVLDKWPGAFTTSHHEAAPPQFPAVEVMEISNVEASYLHDSSNDELGAIVTFEVNCYSNLREGARAQSMALAQSVDREMRLMGFERTFGQQVQNADSAIQRYTTRYTGVASDEKRNVIYRR